MDDRGKLTLIACESGRELAQEQLYGEQLAERIGKRKGGALTAGTIYPALKKLRKHKLIRYSRDGRKKIYTRLAGIEDRHTALWDKLLAENGIEVGAARPSLRARTLAWLARRFGPVR